MTLNFVQAIDYKNLSGTVTLVWGILTSYSICHANQYVADTWKLLHILHIAQSLTTHTANYQWKFTHAVLQLSLQTNGNN